MDSNEVNKLLGGFLGTVFVVFSVGLVSNALFATPEPAKPGYAIEAAPEEAGGAAQAPAEQAKPIAELLASAKPETGAQIFKKCEACHDGTKGGPNKVGPNLWGVVDRPVASHEGFSYSAGMKDFSKGGSEKWTFDNLNHFLTSPKAFVKGTAMGFAGLKKDDERADVIAYLRTLSDSPVPLPEPKAASAAPADASKPAAPADAKPADASAKPAAPADASKPAAPAK
jgi:cytochrome c